jgi:hypothetical protein
MHWLKVDGEPVLIGKGSLTMLDDFPTGRLKRQDRTTFQIEISTIRSTARNRVTQAAKLRIQK